MLWLRAWPPASGRASSLWRRAEFVLPATDLLQTRDEKRGPALSALASLASAVPTACDSLLAVYLSSTPEQRRAVFGRLRIELLDPERALRFLALALGFVTPDPLGSRCDSVAARAAPCSVKANGRCRRPPRGLTDGPRSVETEFEVTNCDLKLANSSTAQLDHEARKRHSPGSGLSWSPEVGSLSEPSGWTDAQDMAPDRPMPRYRSGVTYSAIKH